RPMGTAAAAGILVGLTLSTARRRHHVDSRRRGVDGSVMSPNFDLGGQLALVTGSSRGIGWAVAPGLAPGGGRVILHGRDATAPAPGAAELAESAKGRPAEPLAFDVTDTAAATAAFARIREQHGRLDILVNNAGIIPRRPLLETTDDDWQSVID